ncbi:MAG: lactate utilization protein [Desulfovermiculus sp.]
MGGNAPDTTIQQFWHPKLCAAQSALQARNFGAHIVDTTDDARDLVLNELLPRMQIQTMSWCDSMTLTATRLLQEIPARYPVQVIRNFEADIPRPDLIERRRQALLTDLFLTGTNALTEDGRLINLDMVGNRVAGIDFGPRHVLLFIGRNKLVPGLHAGMTRIKRLSAPANAIRHNFKTPCVKTGRCDDCSSPQRICNTWTITERSFPAQRIQVILINQDLGL